MPLFAVRSLERGDDFRVERAGCSEPTLRLQVPQCSQGIELGVQMTEALVTNVTNIPNSRLLAHLADSDLVPKARIKSCAPPKKVEGADARKGRRPGRVILDVLDDPIGLPTHAHSASPSPKLPSLHAIRIKQCFKSNHQGITSEGCMGDRDSSNSNLDTEGRFSSWSLPDIRQSPRMSYSYHDDGFSSLYKGPCSVLLPASQQSPPHPAIRMRASNPGCLDASPSDISSKSLLQPAPPPARACASYSGCMFSPRRSNTTIHGPSSGTRSTSQLPNMLRPPANSFASYLQHQMHEVASGKTLVCTRSTPRGYVEDGSLLPAQSPRQTPGDSSLKATLDRLPSRPWSQVGLTEAEQVDADYDYDDDELTKEQQEEKDMLSFAAKLGMVRKNNHKAEASNTAALTRALNNGCASHAINQLGIHIKALHKLAENIPKDFTTEQVVNETILPKTRDVKSRYLDLYPEAKKGVPTIYVIHSWQGNFRRMISTLMAYVASMRYKLPTDVFIWIDIICVNQYRPLTAVDYLLMQTAQVSSDYTFLMVDRKGTVFERLWVAFELLAISQAGEHTNSSVTRLVVLPCHWNWNDLKLPYLMWDVSKAKVTKPADKVSLLEELGRRSNGECLQTLAPKLKELLLSVSKEEVSEAEKMTTTSPKNVVLANQAWACMSFLTGRLAQAEDALKRAAYVKDKAVNRGFKDGLLSEEDEAELCYKLALVCWRRGEVNDPEVMLTKFMTQFSEVKDEVYVEGCSMLVDVMLHKKMYTQAEILCRRVVGRREALEGDRFLGMVKTCLQMAEIAAAQKLYAEAVSHVEAALYLAETRYNCQEEIHRCHMLLGMYMFSSRKSNDADSKFMNHLDKAVKGFEAMYPDFHPVLLEALYVKARVLAYEGKHNEAQSILKNVHSKQVSIMGPSDVSTLKTLSLLLEVELKEGKDDDASETEDKMFAAGRSILKERVLDDFRPLYHIADHIMASTHTDILAKGAIFLSKAYAILVEKLTREHELTQAIKMKLAISVQVWKKDAFTMLEKANIFNEEEMYEKSEDLFRICWNVSKLIDPESDHKPLAQGLVESLFGQGKENEARAVMRSAGIAVTGMKDNMPLAYQRWYNKRVGKFMDSQARQQVNAQES